MNNRLLGAALVAAGFACSLGCCDSYHRRSGYSNAALLNPAPCDRCAAGAGVSIPASPVPVQPAPGTVYPNPGPAAPIPGSPQPPGGAPAFTDPLPQPPPAAPQGAGASPGVRLAPPEPDPAITRAQAPEPPAASVPAPPAGADDRSSATIDIPGFANVSARVSTGQRPFPDGVTWLRDRGYRTVLHLRAPGTDDSAAKREFDRANIRYLTLEVSPGTLTKDLVDRFNKLVADEGNLPLFVYDSDGSLAGGLWYLHFRIVGGLADEKARAEAARVGFRLDQDDSHRTMWIAVQKLLEANGR